MVERKNFKTRWLPARPTGLLAAVAHWSGMGLGLQGLEGEWRKCLLVAARMSPLAIARSLLTVLPMIVACKATPSRTSVTTKHAGPVPAVLRTAASIPQCAGPPPGLAPWQPGGADWGAPAAGSPLRALPGPAGAWGPAAAARHSYPYLVH